MATTFDDGYEIRLRGPWEAAWAADQAADDLRFTTVKMPASWRDLFGDRAGTAVFRRSFHRPTNLDAAERVWIVLQDVPGRVELFLNGSAQVLNDAARTVRGDGPHRRVSEITSALQETNRLTIIITWNPAGEPAPGGLWQPVVLHIL